MANRGRGCHGPEVEMLNRERDLRDIENEELRRQVQQACFQALRHYASIHGSNEEGLDDKKRSIPFILIIA